MISRRCDENATMVGRRAEIDTSDATQRHPSERAMSLEENICGSFAINP